MSTTNSRRRAIGLLLRKSDGVTDALTFSFICIGPILNEAYVQSAIEGHGESPKEPFSWFDLAMSSNEWCSSIVGILTDVNHYLEGEDEVLAHRARQLLHREIEFTHHVSLPCVVVELKMNTNYINLAKIVHAFASAGTLSQHFWVKIPLEFADEDESWINEGDDASVPEESSWMVWNRFRSLCNHEPKIFPTLALSVNLPNETIIRRWMGEQVKCIYISPQCFISNSKGYPVMNKRHQLVVKQFMELGAQAIFDPKGLDSSANLTPYHQYIDFIQCSPFDPDIFGRDEYSGIQYTSGYEDYLQCPLQPLQDNLESHTYEVFEKDPVKYELYTDAVHAALLDMVPDEEKESRIITLMVVGAGRGPLVRSSFRAAKRADRRIKVYAIEKNTNAANTLLHLNEREWCGEVTVVNVDMRDWKAPEKADIIVSELLGSFGDNELSPECLDGAQKFLKAGGVMIPQSYDSYIAPVMSSKLYTEVRKMRDLFKNMYSNFETPYVVHMKTRYTIDTPKLVFSFVHPKEDINETNERYTVLNFRSQEECIVHGFGGYFECKLYGDIIMSILPSSFSKGMFSWFPIFFPLRDPIDIGKGQNIKAHFWRCASKSSVWYEWTISSPRSVAIHNPNGRSYTISKV
ncbi:Protein arginine N-methyltransferase 5 [Folsomia candida]|uniref:Protein arginine N-methyltransferase n=1 Tax=Folsomia candida TaxID=158441 RepID=A0A226EZC8_FOLCA|nr:Protein arginine N-methyltransferase 5 [Folsomia candida]